MKTITYWIGSLCLVLSLSMPALGQSVIVEKKVDGSKKEIRIFKKKIDKENQDVHVEIIRGTDEEVKIIKDLDEDIDLDMNGNVWVFKGANDPHYHFEFKSTEFDNEDLLKANVEIQESSKKMKNALAEVDERLENGEITSEEAAKLKAEITFKAAETIIKAADKLEENSSSEIEK